MWLLLTKLNEASEKIDPPGAHMVKPVTSFFGDLFDPFPYKQ